jgi:hypothetical protein
MTTRRLLPPAGTHSAQSANGRSYDPASAAYFDAPVQDAAVLSANGWTDIGPSGPTSARPPVGAPTSGNPTTAVRGLFYVDTDLGKIIVYDGATWRDSAGTAV